MEKMNMLGYKSAAATSFVVALALSGTACDSDDDDKSATNASKGDAGEPDSGSAEGGTVKLDLKVWDFLDQEQPLADSKVCIYPGLTTCETTDQEGYVTLRLPANAKTGFLIDASASDHTKVLVLLTTSDDDLVEDYLVTSKSTAKEFADTVGYKLDPEKAIVVAQTFNSEEEWAGVEGVTVTLTPTAGVGPVYLGADGTPDKSLQATGPNGSAYFGEVPPGEYTLTFSGKNCEVSSYGWKAQGEGAARVTAIADTRSTNAATCGE